MADAKHAAPTVDNVSAEPVEARQNQPGGFGGEASATNPQNRTVPQLRFEESKQKRPHPEGAPSEFGWRPLPPLLPITNVSILAGQSRFWQAFFEPIRGLSQINHELA
jgi:hypothetical protein